MKTNVVVQKSALAQNSSARTLGEGDSIYVRVIKNQGGGKYIVSLGGNRFELSSTIKLNEGETFPAKIKIENQKIFLVQQSGTEIQKSVLENLEGLFSSDGKILNPEIVKYFENLSLFPDFVNYSLLQTMKYLGLNFSHQAFTKARQIAFRFKGKESEAAKTALILAQKGIEPSEENVRAVLSADSESPDSENLNERENFSEPEVLKDSEDSEKSEYSENRDFFSEAEFSDEKFFASENNCENGKSVLSSENDESVNAEKRIFSALKNFFDSLLKGENTQKNPQGLLSLFNHSGFKKTGFSEGGSWIKVPLEFDFFKNGENKSAFGEICFFIKSETKKAEKFACRINFFEKIYKFVLSFKGNSKKIYVSENLDVSELKKTFPELEFEYASVLQNDDFPSDEDFFRILDGKV